MATSILSNSQNALDFRERNGSLSGSPSGHSPVYIDVRTRKEFDTVHIAGSRNFPLSELSQQIEELRKLAQESPLVFVCRTHNRAKRGMGYLHEQGITNCDVLEGGITQWIYEEKPVIRGNSTIAPEGQVGALAGALIVCGVSLAVLVSDWFLLLPTVVGFGLIYAGLTDTCLMDRWLSKLPGDQESSSFLSNQKGG